MKKILILFIAAFAAASCLNGGSFKQSYTADITFEFTNDVYSQAFKDSIYVMSTTDEAFYYGSYPVFFYQKQLNGTFHGGLLLSYLKGEANGELTKEEAANDAYRVHATTGATGSKTYAVFYDNPVKDFDEAVPDTYICGYTVEVPAASEMTLVTTLKKLN